MGNRGSSGAAEGSGAQNPVLSVKRESKQVRSEEPALKDLRAPPAGVSRSVLGKQEHFQQLQSVPDSLKSGNGSEGEHIPEVLHPQQSGKQASGGIVESFSDKKQPRFDPDSMIKQPWTLSSIDFPELTKMAVKPVSLSKQENQLAEAGPTSNLEGDNCKVPRTLLAKLWDDHHNKRSAVPVLSEEGIFEPSKLTRELEDLPTNTIDKKGLGKASNLQAQGTRLSKLKELKLNTFDSQRRKTDTEDELGSVSPRRNKRGASDSVKIQKKSEFLQGIEESPKTFLLKQFGASPEIRESAAIAPKVETGPYKVVESTWFAQAPIHRILESVISPVDLNESDFLTRKPKIMVGEPKIDKNPGRTGIFESIEVQSDPYHSPVINHPFSQSDEPPRSGPSLQEVSKSAQKPDPVHEPGILTTMTYQRVPVSMSQLNGIPESLLQAKFAEVQVPSVVIQNSQSEISNPVQSEAQPARTAASRSILAEFAPKPAAVTDSQTSVHSTTWTPRYSKLVAESSRLPQVEVLEGPTWTQLPRPKESFQSGRSWTTVEPWRRTIQGADCSTFGRQEVVATERLPRGPVATPNHRSGGKTATTRSRVTVDLGKLVDRVLRDPFIRGLAE